MTPSQRDTAARRHDRAPTEAQRDERVRLDVDPEEALRRLLGVDDETADDDEIGGDLDG